MPDVSFIDGVLTAFIVLKKFICVRALEKRNVFKCKVP